MVVFECWNKPWQIVLAVVALRVWESAIMRMRTVAIKLQLMVMTTMTTLWHLVMDTYPVSDAEHHTVLVLLHPVAYHPIYMDAYWDKLPWRIWLF